MKILYCILSGHEYRKTRLKACFDTWAAGKHVIVFSDEDKGCSINCGGSGYVNCPEKVRNGMKRVVKTEDVDWMLFCDDDTYVNTKQLKKYLSKKDDKPIAYGNRINLYKRNRDLCYLSGGGGYAMRPDTLRLIVEKLKKVAHDKFADVMVGYAIQRARIQMSDEKMFHMERPWDYKYTLEEVKQKITFHHLDERQMYMAHRLIYENN